MAKPTRRVWLANPLTGDVAGSVTAHYSGKVERRKEGGIELLSEYYVKDTEQPARWRGAASGVIDASDYLFSTEHRARVWVLSVLVSRARTALLAAEATITWLEGDK